MSGKLVSQFKAGVITPVHKKGKPQRNPDSYHRITVNSIIGKVFEKELLDRTKKILNPQQHELQFGFTEKCSSTHCALMLTEATAEVLDTGRTLYITFMDAKKAFDVVWHESMLVSLHNSSVTGPMWNMYDNMYTDLTSQVKIDGNLSVPIKELQGIRQGGLTSTELFKNRSNMMLKRLAELPDSFRIGCLPIGAPTTADDTALLSSTKLGAQAQIFVAQDDANNQRYGFSSAKTKVQIVNNPSHEIVSLSLNKEPIEISLQETHLGVQ